MWCYFELVNGSTANSELFVLCTYSSQFQVAIAPNIPKTSAYCMEGDRCA